MRMSSEEFIEVACSKCGAKRAVFPEDPEDITCYSCGHALRVPRSPESASGTPARTERTQPPTFSRARVPTKVPLRSWLIIFGIPVVLAALILALYISSQWSSWFAEWKQSKPPVWAYVDSTDVAREYINTQMVVRFKQGSVAVLIKHVTRNGYERRFGQKEMGGHL